MIQITIPQQRGIRFAEEFQKRLEISIVSYANDLLRLNVGFIIHESVGYTRDFPIEAPVVHLEPDLDLTDLDGYARVTRTAQGLLVQVKLTAKASAECVRCLSPMQQPLHTDFTELYSFNRDSVTESGLLVPESGKIDLAPLVREEMLLSMPISTFCRPDCKGLCPVCGENLNDNPHNHEDEPPDTLLSVLKTLLDPDGEQEAGKE